MCFLKCWDGRFNADKQETTSVITRLNNQKHMPEGPTILILKDAVQQFRGKPVLTVGGNRKIDLQRMAGLTIKDFLSFGKQFLICFDGFFVRIHFLLFGSYLINDRKEASPRLSLYFENGEANFYSCSVRYVEGDPNEWYDWSRDVMSPDWNPEAAKVKLQNNPEMLVCDALLNQDIFAGVGNIIKNEVLYRTRVHPETLIGNLPNAKLDEIIKEARIYSFEFLHWREHNELKKHWLAYRQKMCSRCQLKIVRRHLGATHRRTFFCENCQIKYDS